MSNSLCAKRLQAAVGRFPCKKSAAEEVAVLSQNYAAEDEYAADAKAVTYLVKTHASKYLSAAQRGVCLTFPDTSRMVVLTLNSFSGVPFTLTPTGRDNPVQVSNGQAAKWIVQLTPRDASDMSVSATIQAYPSGLMLCTTKAGEVVTRDETQFHGNKRDFEFLFVKTKNDMFLILPKTHKGKCLRGSVDGQVGLYSFKSGRVNCSYADGLGGAVDDYLTPNTAEWDIAVQSQGVQGAVIGESVTSLPADLCGQDTLVYFESASLTSCCLSCIKETHFCCTRRPPSGLEVFRLQFCSSVHWRISSQQVPGFEVYVKLISVQWDNAGENIFLLYTPKLEYITCEDGATDVRFERNYTERSFWRIRQYRMESLSALSWGLRKVAGAFPNKGRGSVRRAAHVERMVAVTKAAQRRKAAGIAAAQLLRSEELALREHLTSLSQRSREREVHVAAVDAGRCLHAEVVLQVLCSVVALSASVVGERFLSNREAACEAAAAAVLSVVTAQTADIDLASSLQCRLDALFSRLDTFSLATKKDDGIEPPSWWKSRSTTVSSGW